MRAPQSMALVLGLAAAACYPREGSPPGSVSPATVQMANQRWPGTTEASLEAGRTTFLAKCNNCHDYPDRSAIAEDRWPGILDDMAKKAHLNPTQKDQVLHFVIASRSDR